MVWVVTEADRGFGVSIVNAALAAGHAVVITGSSTDAICTAFG